MNCTQGGPDQIACLTPGQRIGLALDAEAGLISITALVVVFTSIFKKMYHSGKFVQRPMDLFLVVLFSFDIIMALGRVTNIKWVQEARVFDGSYCTAQGVLQQFGETGSAMVTTLIAIYTFMVVVWGQYKRQLEVACGMIGLIFLFLILFIGITVSTQTHGSQDYMTPDGFWCWIGNGPRSNGERYGGEAMWMWFALCISIITYAPLAFLANGVLRINSNNWWKFERNGRRDAQVEGQKRRAISMITYPVVYSILIIPLTVLRCVGGFGTSPRHLPSAATLTAECIFSLSGLANVMIFLSTRSNLFMVDNTESSGHSLGRVAPPPPGVPEHNDEELPTARQPPGRSVLPRANNGLWSLERITNTSEPV